MTTTVHDTMVFKLEGEWIDSALEKARAELAKVKSQRSALYFTLLKDVCERVFRSEEKLRAMIAQLEGAQAHVGSIN